MYKILWNGSSLLAKDNQLVFAPGDCCCCTNSCSFPSGDPSCPNEVNAFCSGNSCSLHFFDCTVPLVSGLDTQGYNIYYNENCCNCEGYYLNKVYACCSGFVDLNDFILVPMTGIDCQYCQGSELISLEYVGEEVFWKIFKCNEGETYYCIQE